MLLGVICALSLLIGLGVCAGAGVFAGFHWLWVLPVTFVLSFLVIVGVGCAGLMYLCKKVNLDEPQEEDDPLYRIVTEWIIGGALPFLRIFVKKQGMEKVPREGRFMLVCNHTDDSDPIILLSCFPGRQLAFIAKREVRDMFVIGPMMHKLQCQLINRENDREALKTILKCIQMLKDDTASIGVFPEGRIDDDRKLHHFRPGVFKIAQKAGVPIVVCTLKNASHVVHDLLHLKSSHVEMTVLEVIGAEELKGVTTVEIAERVYKLMADDLGPENVAEE